MAQALIIVTDELLYRPVREKLQHGGWTLRPEMRDEGVLIATHASEGSIFVLIDPAGYYVEDAISALRRESQQAAHVYALAPSIIQYFVPKLNEGHPMTFVIDALANHLVVVQNPAVIRMSPVGPDGADALRHRVSFGSVPARQQDVKSGYVRADGRLVDAIELPVQSGGVIPREIVKPIVFQHAALNELVIGKFMAIVDDESAGSAERNALAYYAATFPSKEISPQLVASIAKVFAEHQLGSAAVDDIAAACTYNRSQWQLARTKLRMVGMEIPDTPDDDSQNFEHAYSFLHLISGNFHDFAQGLNIDLKAVNHLGLPVLARDGLTMTFGRKADGSYGINATQTRPMDFSQNVIQHALDMVWPSLVALEMAELESV